MKKFLSILLFISAAIPRTAFAAGSSAAESSAQVPAWIIIVLAAGAFVISAGIGLAVYKLVTRKKSG